MRGWITVTLLLTFVSGGTTGLVVGRQTAPVPAKVEWYEGYLDQLRAEGVTIPQDIEDAKQIYIEYDKRVRDLTDHVKRLLDKQIVQISEDAERKIQEIRDRRKKKAD